MSAGTLYLYSLGITIVIHLIAGISFRFCNERKCFAYTVALCCIVLAAASWYRLTQLEAVVKEYYIIKPILKEDRKYAPFIHTMDSVILKDGIDEVCERVYGERTK